MSHSAEHGATGCSRHTRAHVSYGIPYRDGAVVIVFSRVFLYLYLLMTIAHMVDSGLGVPFYFGFVCLQKFFGFVSLQKIVWFRLS